jgi:hypothetical protein
MRPVAIWPARQMDVCGSCLGVVAAPLGDRQLAWRRVEAEIRLLV